MKKHTVYFWEKAPMSRLILPFSLGIMVYDSFGHIPISHLHFFLPITMFLGLIGLGAFYKFPTTSLLAMLMGNINLHLWLFLAAYYLACLADPSNHPAWAGKHLSRTSDFIVRIDKIPEKSLRSWKVLVEMKYAVYPQQCIPVKGKAILYVPHQQLPQFPYEQGNELIVKGNWRAPSKASNPYCFNYARYAQYNGIAATLYTPLDSIFLLANQNAARLSIWAKLQWMGIQSLSQKVSDPATLGLLLAMLLGDEHSFDHAQRELYAHTGIIHVVAISGGHVAFLFTILSSLLWWLKNPRTRWIMYFLAIPLTWIYVLLAGTPPSAVRAAVMFSLLAIGYIFEQQTQPINLLFSAAMWMLCVDPFWLFSIGFLLSFTAVLSILIFYRPILHLWEPRSFILRYLWSATAVSLAAEILIAPLVIYYFHHFPLLFLPANILAGVLMSAIMVSGMLLIIISGKMATILVFITSNVVKYFNNALEGIDNLNPQSFSKLYLSGSELICIYIVITGLILIWLSQNRKGIYILLAGLIGIITIQSYRLWQQKHQELWVVYQGGENIHIEHIRGQQAVVCYSTSKEPHIPQSYNTPLHLHRGIREIKAFEFSHSGFYQVGKTKILLITEKCIPHPDKGTFPVDILVLAYPQTYLPLSQWLQTFPCTTLVLAGKQNKQLVSKWKEEAFHIGIYLHNIQENGAYHYEK
jgi:competence protein ComEC